MRAAHTILVASISVGAGLTFASLGAVQGSPFVDPPGQYCTGAEMPPPVAALEQQLEPLSSDERIAALVAAIDAAQARLNDDGVEILSFAGHQLWQANHHDEAARAFAALLDVPNASAARVDALRMLGKHLALNGGDVVRADDFLAEAIAVLESPEFGGATEWRAAAMWECVGWRAVLAERRGDLQAAKTLRERLVDEEILPFISDESRGNLLFSIATDAAAAGQHEECLFWLDMLDSLNPGFGADDGRWVTVRWERAKALDPTHATEAHFADLMALWRDCETDLSPRSAAFAQALYIALSNAGRLREAKVVAQEFVARFAAVGPSADAMLNIPHEILIDAHDRLMTWAIRDRDEGAIQRHARWLIQNAPATIQASSAEQLLQRRQR